MMAMLLLLQERAEARAAQPLLSGADVVRLLAYALPRRDVTEAEIMAQWKQRHRQRQRQQPPSSDRLTMRRKM